MEPHMIEARKNGPRLEVERLEGREMPSHLLQVGVPEAAAAAARAPG